MSESVHSRVSVSTTQNEPNGSESADISGKPAHAFTPIAAMDGLFAVSGLADVSPAISGSPEFTTYWQNDSSTVFWVGPSGGMPMRDIQNERCESTRVMKANGAFTRLAASVARSSKDGSGPVSSRPVAATALRRAGSSMRLPGEFCIASG